MAPGLMTAVIYLRDERFPQPSCNIRSPAGGLIQSRFPPQNGTIRRRKNLRVVSSEPLDKGCGSAYERSERRVRTAAER
jgi:hypothetical protein